MRADLSKVRQNVEGLVSEGSLFQSAGSCVRWRCWCVVGGGRMVLQGVRICSVSRRKVWIFDISFRADRGRIVRAWSLSMKHVE